MHSLYRFRLYIQEIFYAPSNNKAVKEAMPRWVLKASELMALGDAKLQEFDDYMVDQFRTIPGIVHEGCEGMIGVAMPAATSATFKLGGGIVRGVSRGVTSTAKAVKKIPNNTPLLNPAFAKPQVFQQFVRDEVGAKTLTIIETSTPFPRRPVAYQPQVEEIISTSQITFNDVGIPLNSGWEHRATMTLYNNRLAVKLDWIKAPKGAFSLENYVSHLLDLTRAHQVQIMEFEAMFTNPKFCTKWKTKYEEKMVRNYQIRSGARKIEFCKFEFTVP